jgi:3-methylcrotonyl-CoA carboxylase alpha subunit
MIAKLIVHAPTRAEALKALDKELDDAVVIGPKTNLAFLRALMRSPEVVEGAFDTGFIDAHLGRLGAVPQAPDSRAALAAALRLLARRDAERPSPLAAFDPWGVADSFELAGPRRLSLDAIIDGKPERLQVIGAGQHALEAAGKRASAADRPEITLFETAEGVYAFAGGRQAFVTLVDPLERAAGGAEEGDGGIRAPMNGRIVALTVEEGETVETGQRLAVVEAMKMEHALTAPFAGVVADLTGNVGDQVEMGERIMRVEAGEAPEAKT